ncbi:PREDICTED: polyamine-modulated factor 1 isoform X2 [Lipotes vexillifer]|uniref:Polyamine-modulated factor 1 isoform X2 n=1 Tax=Lipotes vexillifer TaxID=118797 RepID=A0A340X8Q6_LIPVE|nr:PREDICTED: polyamine-modulated factor 1 isoform X2 [Lipotes vexillifer]
MAEASGVNVGSGCEEKGPEELSQESARPGTTISRVKLFDTMVDTFIQKLVAAGSQSLLHYIKSFHPPSGGQSVEHAFSRAASRLPWRRKEEISEIKAEGNLKAVLNALDAIVEGRKDCEEPAWRPSGIPEKDLCSAVVPYFLQQRDALQRRVQKQEAENRQLADAVLAGRRQVEELQLQGQARQQAWQALHREQKELVAVLREPE